MSSFEILKPLIRLDAAKVSQMANAIETPAFARSAAYVSELLDPLRSSAEIAPAREWLVACDPYFIGAAHGRLKFQHDEVVDNLDWIMSCPAHAVARWQNGRSAIVTWSDNHEASREGYARARSANPSDLSALLDAIALVSAVQAVGVLVEAGTRRLAFSPTCIGSSSISSLPGFSMIEAAVSEPGSVIFGPTQLNGLVHEAVHGVLFLAECLVGRELVLKGSRSRVVSPWSGNLLDSYQFIQACVVWHVLLAFWDEIAPDAPERSRAAIGFRIVDGVPSGAMRELKAIRGEVQLDVLPVLDACLATSQARA